MENNKPASQAPVPEENSAIETVKKNKNTIIGACVVVVIVVVAAIAWYLVSSNNSKKADEAVAAADVEMFAPMLFGTVPNDSVALDKYMAAAEAGHKSGDRAAMQAAVLLYQKGDYQKAIDYLKKASSSSSIVEAGRYSLMGDCYVNLKNNAEAVSAFKSAYSAADKNPTIAPFILVKQANLYREMGDFNAEANAYETIVKEYPTYVQQLGQNQRVDLLKFVERAKASAAK